jgi:putative resolvase
MYIYIKNKDINMKAKEVMFKFGITRNTLYNWVKNGKINVNKTPSGRYEYVINDFKENSNRKNVIYARVSTSNQKENLERQIERIKLFASSKGVIINQTYTDIASALNYNRNSYVNLINSIMNNEIDKVFIEYCDRLVRFGYEDIERLCKKFNTEIIVIDDEFYNKDKNKISEITEDLISIIHHFSMKIYSSRKRKNIIEMIKEEDVIN